MSSIHSNESSNNSWTPLFDRFNQTIRAEADTLFKHLVDSQTNLTNERDSLRKEIEQLRKEKDEMTQLLKKFDQVVTLNVGGQLFSTTVDTLTKETCLFTKMFSGRFDLGDHQGATFIDRDPTHFRILLNYLRTSTFIEPKSIQDRAELLLEAEYYQITSLVNRLKQSAQNNLLVHTSDLKCESPANVVVVEKLVFDSSLHHPKVIISENGLVASHPGTCVQYLYAKASNVSWQTGRHYWEIIMESANNCYSSMGVATSMWDTNKRLGDDSYSWTLRLYNQHTDYKHTGIKHDNKSSSYYNIFPKGTRVGALLDLDAGTLEYVIDGIKKGIAFTNLKGHTITPVIELCHQTTFRMNHSATAPIV